MTPTNLSSFVIDYKAPANCKPGVEELVNLCVHVCNASLNIDHAVNTGRTDVADFMNHALGLVDTVGPHLAEVDNPLETLVWIQYVINDSVVHTIMPQAQMAASMGKFPDAQRLLMECDHIVAVVTQAFAELFVKHLEAVKYSPVVEG